MLALPKGYLEDEERDGFLVEAEMKSFWASQMELLLLVDEICEKHGLKYFVAYGTLLGAARHNGYIPWDDDVDIWMLREDYEAFLSIAEEELPGGYKVIDVHSAGEWQLMIARVVNATGLLTSELALLKYHGCPYAVGLDIFPLDYIPDDEKALEYKDNALQTAISAAYEALDSNEQNNEKIYRQLYNKSLSYLEKTFDFKFFKEANIINQLYSLADFIAASNNPEDGHLVTNYTNYIVYKKSYIFHKLWFSEVIKLGFEVMNVSAPIGVEAILNTCYGNNFMTPYRGGAAHDYPIYKGQREILIANGLKDFVDEKRKSIAKLMYSDDAQYMKEEGKEPIPQDILELLSDKKIILYVLNSANILRYKENIIDKFERAINIFEESKDKVAVILAEDITFLATFNAEYPDLFEKYMNIRQKISDNIGFVSDNLYYDFASVCDAYYGDATTVIGDFMKAGKPIMLQNYTL